MPAMASGAGKCRRHHVGVKALVAAGIADPKRVGIRRFYGGYATLAGVAFTPAVYAAAVAYVAPSNLITLLDAIRPTGSGTQADVHPHGDPTTRAGKAC